MLRIHFTAEDLARTSLAATADPLWEIPLSRFRLHDRDRPVAFRPWTRRLRASRPAVERIRPGIRLLTVLAPLGPYFPDFLTPPEARAGLDAGLDALRATPRTLLRDQLDRLAQHSPVPEWVRPLADGQVDSLVRLGDMLRGYYDSAIAAHADIVQGSIEADHTHRARTLVEQGLEGLLADLGPRTHWQSPVLQIDCDVDRDLYLNGRGLRLVPSYFCHGAPISLADPELPPVLVYPIDQQYRWTQAITTGDRRPLAALVGQNRANILRAVDTGATTSQLGRRLGTSPASVSRHTAVLREAGLIISHRHHSAVLHTLTPLGAALLEAGEVSDRP